jgi:hypothetical protein
MPRHPVMKNNNRRDADGKQEQHGCCNDLLYEKSFIQFVFCYKVANIDIL